jgi:hypothetical protein
MSSAAPANPAEACTNRDADGIATVASATVPTDSDPAAVEHADCSSVHTAPAADAVAPAADAAALVFTSVSFGDPGLQNLGAQVAQEHATEDAFFDNAYGPNHPVHDLLERIQGSQELDEVNHDAVEVASSAPTVPPHHNTSGHFTQSSAPQATQEPHVDAQMSLEGARDGLFEDSGTSQGASASGNMNSQHDEGEGAVAIHQMYRVLQEKQALQKAKAEVLSHGAGSGAGSGVSGLNTNKSPRALSTKPSSRNTDPKKLSSTSSTAFRDSLLPRVCLPLVCIQPSSCEYCSVLHKVATHAQLVLSGQHSFCYL